MPLKQVLIRRGLPIVADVPAPQVSDNTILVEVAFSLISTGTESANLSSGGKSVLQQAYQEPAKIVRGLQLVQQVGVRRAMEIVNGELDAVHAAGYSCSGTVVACGRRVVGFAPGDRVACAGANKANHAEIVQHVTAVNRTFEIPAIAQFWNPATDGGRAALDAMITTQAQIIAYIDDFKLLMIATLAVIPLLPVFKQASGGGGDHSVVVE